MGRTTFNDDVHVNGTLTAARFNPPVNSVGAGAIQAAAGIEATKLEHQFPVSAELFAEGVTIAAVSSRVVHVVKGATGEVVAIEGVIFGAATGDRTVTVDLQKSTGGAAFATHPHHHHRHRPHHRRPHPRRRRRQRPRLGRRRHPSPGRLHRRRQRYRTPRPPRHPHPPRGPLMTVHRAKNPQTRNTTDSRNKSKVFGGGLGEAFLQKGSPRRLDAKHRGIPSLPFGNGVFYRLRQTCPCLAAMFTHSRRHAYAGVSMSFNRLRQRNGNGRGASTPLRERRTRTRLSANHLESADRQPSHRTRPPRAATPT